MNTPIVFIDADEDDQIMFTQTLIDLDSVYPLVVLSNGQAALEYLKTTSQVPFLIISEISMPGMSGLELRQQIESDPDLRKKMIPFLFMTYPVVDYLVEQAYELTIQGLFEKQTSLEDWKRQLDSILTYWTEFLHPKRFGR